MQLPPNADANFVPPPEGNHLAVCYRVIDLGTQQIEWNGALKHQRKVMLSWELPEEKMSDGQPFSVHQRYTLSSSDKATLRQHLESWRGRAFTEADFGPNGFNIRKVIGVPCMLAIIHATKNGRTYGNIRAIAKLPKGMSAPKPVNTPIYFSLDPPEYDEALFASLSDGLRVVIMRSPEYQQLRRQPTGEPPVEDAPPPRDLDDEIPF